MTKQQIRQRTNEIVDTSTKQIEDGIKCGNKKITQAAKRSLKEQIIDLVSLALAEAK